MSDRRSILVTIGVVVAGLAGAALVMWVHGMPESRHEWGLFFGLLSVPLGLATALGEWLRRRGRRMR